MASASNFFKKQIRFFFPLFCFHLDAMTLDQTPTPTRFLQNCEEVGLFKEIEKEFLQAQEEENKKQVSLTSFLLLYYFISLKINHQF